MAKRKFLSDTDRAILRGIKDGLMIASLFLMPGLGIVYKKGIARSNRKQYVQRRVRQLLEDNIIYLGGEKVILSERGKQLSQLAEAEDILLATKSDDIWNGVWQLVSYDIPNKQVSERDYFRCKLMEAGFRLIQKSLWIYPYYCREEIAILTHSLWISPYVIYMQTQHIPREDKYLKIFSLEDKFEES